MTKTRRRFKQTASLQDRLALFAQDNRAKAAKLPDGPRKRELLQKVGNAEIAADIDQWRSSTAAPVGSFDRIKRDRAQRSS